MSEDGKSLPWEMGLMEQMMQLAAGLETLGWTPAQFVSVVTRFQVLCEIAAEQLEVGLDLDLGPPEFWDEMVERDNGNLPFYALRVRNALRAIAAAGDEDGDSDDIYGGDLEVAFGILHGLYPGEV